MHFQEIVNGSEKLLVYIAENKIIAKVARADVHWSAIDWNVALKCCELLFNGLQTKINKWNSLLATLWLVHLADGLGAGAFTGTFSLW